MYLKWRYGLDDHYRFLNFNRDNIKYVGEVESSRFSPWGGWMSFSEAVYSLFGITYITAYGYLNYDRYRCAQGKPQPSKIGLLIDALKSVEIGFEKDDEEIEEEE